MRPPAITLRSVSVSGYRSVRSLELDLSLVTMVLGPNGCGKTNLYRAMGLLAAAARGELARTIALEGGMESALWAGPRKRGSARVRITAVIDDVQYAIEIGLPAGGRTVFCYDPEVKRETVTHLGGRRPVVLVERTNTAAWVRDSTGARITYPVALDYSESILAQLAEPHLYPELSRLRQHLLGWRFHHHIRTDEHAPARNPCVTVRTPVLAADGGDLAAALQTIMEEFPQSGLESEIDRAFPGHSIEIRDQREQAVDYSAALLELRMRTPGINRPLTARELSDGTLRYLSLVAALLTPRPPRLLVINEPETSLHPDLVAPLGGLIVRASRRTQIWLTTHSAELARVVAAQTGIEPVRLERRHGATVLAGSEEDLVYSADDEDADEEDQSERE